MTLSVPDAQMSVLQADSKKMSNRRPVYAKSQCFEEGENKLQMEIAPWRAPKWEAQMGLRNLEGPPEIPNSRKALTTNQLHQHFPCPSYEKFGPVS
jgi:hypothetical protein